LGGVFFDRDADAPPCKCRGDAGGTRERRLKPE